MIHIGYHYTSYKNWLKIKKEGLKPEPIYLHDELYIRLAELGYPQKKVISGIWLWRKFYSGIPHIGSVIRVLVKHNDTKIVFLKVTFSDSDQFEVAGHRLELNHDGMIGKFVYHHSEKHKAYLVDALIPPSQIELVKIYDLVKILKVDRGQLTKE